MKKVLIFPESSFRGARSSHDLAGASGLKRDVEGGLTRPWRPCSPFQAATGANPAQIRCKLWEAPTKNFGMRTVLGASTSTGTLAPGRHEVFLRAKTEQIWKSEVPTRWSCGSPGRSSRGTCGARNLFASSSPRFLIVASCPIVSSHRFLIFILCRFVKREATAELAARIEPVSGRVRSKRAEYDALSLVSVPRTPRSSRKLSLSKTHSISLLFFPFEE